MVNLSNEDLVLTRKDKADLLKLIQMKIDVYGCMMGTINRNVKGWRPNPDERELLDALEEARSQAVRHYNLLQNLDTLPLDFNMALYKI